MFFRNSEVQECRSDSIPHISGPRRQNTIVLALDLLDNKILLFLCFFAWFFTFQSVTMANEKVSVTIAENSIVTRAAIIASVVLAGIFIALLFFQGSLVGVFGRFADEATIGLMLLGLWLVVTSTVRSVNNLSKSILGWKLVLVGVLTGLLSAILTTAFLLLFPNIAKSKNMAEVTGASGAMILVIAGLSFVIGLISIVNLKVKSRALGNFLELLIIGALIAFSIWWATK